MQLPASSCSGMSCSRMGLIAQRPSAAPHGSPPCACATRPTNSPQVQKCVILGPWWGCWNKGPGASQASVWTGAQTQGCIPHKPRGLQFLQAPGISRILKGSCTVPMMQMLKVGSLRAWGVQLMLPDSCQEGQEHITFARGQARGAGLQCSQSLCAHYPFPRTTL